VLPESAQRATSEARSKRPSSVDGSASRKNGRRSASPTSTSAAVIELSAPDGDPALVQEEGEEPDLDWFGRGVRPAHLEGRHASEWRGMVVSDMFRGGRGYVPQPDPSGRHFYSPAWTHASLPPYTSAPFATSYLVVGPAVRGQFLPKEAQAQGVKPGPDFAKLIAGQLIDLPDGKQLDLARCFTAGAPAAVRSV
jgi:ribonuclease Z